MIAIIFATREEAQPFLDRYRRGRFDGLREGEPLYDDHLLVALTGVGKIKATLHTERLLQHFKPESVLHAGTCTALRDTLASGTLVAASQVLEGDRIELSALTYPRMPLDVPFEEVATGALVTQDHVAQGEHVESYWQRIADVTDMTGYPVAYVAATYGIPCHILKVVTGTLDGSGEDFKQAHIDGCEALGTYLVRYLETTNAVS